MFLTFRSRRLDMSSSDDEMTEKNGALADR
jgi:hypothetical protein